MDKSLTIQNIYFTIDDNPTFIYKINKNKNLNIFYSCFMVEKYLRLDTDLLRFLFLINKMELRFISSMSFYFEIS